MPIQPDLSGQAILITGAGRGLGRSMAEKLASCGAAIAVVDIDAAACESVTEAIRKRGGAAVSAPADVSDRTALMDVAAQFARERGRIDVVINNAMLLRYEPVENVTEGTLQRMVSIGVHGTVWGTQALLAHYDRERGGSIINMASPVAEPTAS
jgi:NAD(P)-dependent dehydrogenase (short-subunit alcohol dehydrogenase family)